MTDNREQLIEWCVNKTAEFMKAMHDSMELRDEAHRKYSKGMSIFYELEGNQTEIQNHLSGEDQEQCVRDAFSKSGLPEDSVFTPENVDKFFDKMFSGKVEPNPSELSI